MDNDSMTRTVATLNTVFRIEGAVTPRSTHEVAAVLDRPQPMNDRVELIQRILDCSVALFQTLNPGCDRAWQALDLTMPQLKALICVVNLHGATGTQVASALGVGLSTVTGIVDRLASQGLVSRREDPADRRVTRVLPSVSGQQLVDELLPCRKEAITAILSRTDVNQLRVVETAFQYLLEAIKALAANRQAQEVVA
jgi:DNA-binding MarR family transcriptional regulator